MMAHGRFCLLLGLLSLSGIHAGAEDWSRWRGPDGAGHAAGSGIPSTWTEEDYRWKVELPGIGHSSPVVWEDQIIVSSALQEDGTKIIRSLAISNGNLVWEKRIHVNPAILGNSTSHDKASPAVDSDRVYVNWSSKDGFHVAALDRKSGNELWRRTLGPFEGEHGTGASPIRFGDLLIISNDQAGPSSTMGLDPETGQTVWKVKRKAIKTAFSTPTIYLPEGGTAQLILTSTGHGVSSLDPGTGHLNWEVADVFGTIRVTGSAVVANGLIFAQCGAGGAGKRMVAIRPPDPPNGSGAEVAYDIKGSIPYVPTPVAFAHWLFAWSDGGIVSCIDTRTGERVWRERVGGNFFGSPILVGDRIFCISREGEVVVLKAGPEFELLGRVDLEEPSHSTPAVRDGVIYLRTISHLMALGSK